MREIKPAHRKLAFLEVGLSALRCVDRGCRIAAGEAEMGVNTRGKADCVAPYRRKLREASFKWRAFKLMKARYGENNNKQYQHNMPAKATQWR